MVKMRDDFDTADNFFMLDRQLESAATVREVSEPKTLHARMLLDHVAVLKAQDDQMPQN